MKINGEVVNHLETEAEAKIFVEGFKAASTPNALKAFNIEIVEESALLPTEIFCLIDKSYSMSTMTDATIEGYNSFLADQGELGGNAKLSLVMFDDELVAVSMNSPLSEAEKLNTDTYRPRGNTRLNDAIMFAVESLSGREATSQIVVLIITDGQENASVEHRYTDIKSVIKQKEELGWSFVMIGSTPEAMKGARDYGISNSAQVGHDSKGYDSAYRGASGMLRKKRVSGETADIGTEIDSQ